VVHRRYRDRIFRLAYAYVNNVDDAEDVTQIVFVRAHKALGKFKGNSQLFTWLYRIALNCCKDWVKQAHIIRCDGRDDTWWSGRGTEDSLFSRSDRADHQAEQLESNDILSAALEKLRPEFRSALIHREIDGMSYRQISQVLSCSEGTVKSRISRARHQLRKNLIPFRHAI
jgi:RNA polymerase sigma-70 factor (ECF subfamily)